MRTIAARISAAYPATNRNEGLSLIPLRNQMLGTLRPTVLSLMGAVGLVLLIACANVANLCWCARLPIAGRSPSARRSARFGGACFRSFSHRLPFCVSLGSAFGIALAGTALPLLRVALSHTSGLDASLIPSIQINIPVLLFILAVCMVTATLFGLSRSGRRLLDWRKR